MTINSAVMFWMACDHPGCRMESENDDTERMAFATAGECVDTMTHEYGGWVERDGKHYCEEHR